MGYIRVLRFLQKKKKKKKKPPRSKIIWTNGATDLFTEFTREASIKGTAYYTEQNRNQGENITKIWIYTIQINWRRIM